MKILCVSDQIDPLIYTDSIKQNFAGVDLVLSAGDLPMDYLDFIASTLGKPLLFVLGNQHTKASPDHNTGIHVDVKIHREKELIIAGLGGSMRFNQGENQFTDFQMYFRILTLLPALFFNRIFRGRFLDILLTHASPLGIHDKEDPNYRGFKSFLWFMRVFKPRYLVHGHKHLYNLGEVRTSKYCDTLVINAYCHYLIDTREKT